MRIRDKLPSRNLLLVTSIITLGSAFQHGYYTACLNTPYERFTKWMAKYLRLKHMILLEDSEINTHFFYAIVTSLYFFGGAIGSLLSGPLLEKFDHTVLVMANLLLMVLPTATVIVGYLMEIPLLFMIARVVAGIISGMFSCAVPSYLVDISPKNIRGMICCWYMVMYAVGVASALCFGLRNILGDEPWIYIMTIGLIPMAIQLPLMKYCPKSPRYLLLKENSYDDALEVLRWLRLTDNINILEKELEEMSSELEDVFLYRSMNSIDWSDFLRLSYLRKPLLISIMMMCAQQICGINVFLLYSTAIFNNTKLPSHYIVSETVLMGGMFIFMSILCALLIDKAGRRMLFIYGYIGTFVFSFVHYMTYMYNKAEEECVGAAASLFVLFFVAHYLIGPHSVPWLIIPEMFDEVSRPKAMSLATFCNWTMNSFVALLFWPLEGLWRAQVFLFFIVPHMLFFFPILKYVPETTKKSIKEIMDIYR